MNARTELLTSLLQTAMDNHANQIRVVSSLEDKAQKTSTVAGVFLAAAFGFTRPEILRIVYETHWGQILFVTTVGLLVVCILLCLSVNWVRRMPGAVTVFVIEEAARDVL